MVDNEPAPRPTPQCSVPGFVVGHHLGKVTVEVRRRIHCELALDDAYALALALLRHRDLAYAQQGAA